MRIRRMVAVLFGSLLFFLNCLGFSAFAETSLPDGAVKGLPERLAALDDEGNPVNSETGEYFFHVENMEFGETYTKEVQLMNLREDEGYHIWFYVEPLFKKGDIDLEIGCECRFYLDGVEFYKGTVNGDGNIDLKTDHFDCGYYAPGDSHAITAEVTWNNYDSLKGIDNGWKMIDKDGEHILVEADGTTHVEGEIEFKWIFYSQIEVEPDEPEKDNPDNGGSEYAPQTGLFLKNGTFWLICIGVIAAAVGVLLILIFIKKKKESKK